MILRNKNKLFSLIVIFALIFFMSACNGETPSITGDKDIEVLVGTEIPDLMGCIDLIDIDAADVDIDYTAVDIDTVGSYKVVYTINSGNEDQIDFEITLHVVDHPIDNTPLIYGVQDIVHVIGESHPDLLEGITALDKDYGNITQLISIDDSNVEYYETGTYDIVYYVMNIDGYSQSVNAQVQVVFNDSNPVIPDEFIIVSDEFYGLKSITGQTLLPNEYDVIEYYGDRMLRLLKDDISYFYNLDTKTYHQYDYMLESMFFDGVAVVQNELELYTYMNKSGNIILPFKYSEVDMFIDGKAIVKMGDNYGLIDKTGAELIGVKYEDVKMFMDGHYLKQIDDRYLIVTGNDEFVLEVSSDYYNEYTYEDIDSVFYKVEIDGYYALLNEDLEVLMNNEFTTVTRYYEDFFYGRDENYVMTLFNHRTDTYFRDISGFNVSGDIYIIINENGAGLYDSVTENFTIYPKYEHLRRFSLNEDELFIATREDGKMAIINKMDEFTVGFEISSIDYHPVDDYVIFQNLDNLSGTIGSNGAIVAHPIYSSIEDNVNGFALVLKDSTGLYGYLDETGAEVVHPSFFDALDFSQGFAQVKRVDNELGWTYINEAGYYISSELYKDLEDFSNGYAKVRVADQGGMPQWKFIDELGQEISTVAYAYLSDMHNGYTVVKTDLYENSVGLMNSEGELILPCEYKSVMYPNNGMITVVTPGEVTKYYNLEEEAFLDIQFYEGLNFSNDRAVIKNTFGYRAVIDKQGNIIKDFSNILINGYSHNVAVFFDVYNYRYGLLDMDGENILDAEYIHMSSFNNSLARIQLQTGKWGFIDATGEMIIEATYTNVHNFDNDSIYTYVSDNQFGSYMQGIIDISGNVVFETRYSVQETLAGYQVSDDMMFNVDVTLIDDVLTYDIIGADNKVYTMTYDGGWMLYDGETMVIDKGYTSIEYLDYADMWMVKKGTNYGVLNSSFEVVVEPVHNNIYVNIDDNFINVSFEGNQGILKMDGTTLIPVIYDEVYYSSRTETFTVINGEVIGLYNREGSLIIPVQYQDIEYINGDYRFMK